ncbi:hypothetical protein VO54_00020 [Elizabethkingia miricola]|nr:hypothetical protein VO54_00020 [Elizabethkingia miricola]
MFKKLNFTKSIINNQYLIISSGVIFIITGISYFTVSNIHVCLFLTGLSFMISSLLNIIFFFKNRYTIEGWGFYLIFLMIVLNGGLYFLLNTEAGITLGIGIICLFNLFIFLGFMIDLKKYAFSDSNLLIKVNILIIILSIIFLTKSPAINIILVGINFILLDFELKKFKKRYAYIKQLTKI